MLVVDLLLFFLRSSPLLGSWKKKFSFFRSPFFIFFVLFDFVFFVFFFHFVALHKEKKTSLRREKPELGKPM